EVVPYPAYSIDLDVRPGDRITGSVDVLARAVRLEVVNRTRHWTFARTISWPSPDTSSAEWIVEAPGICVRFACSPKPLADFGSVTTPGIAATGNSFRGALSDPAWQVIRIRLVPRTHSFTLDSTGEGEAAAGRTPHVRTLTAGSVPGALSAGGTAFTV